MIMWWHEKCCCCCCCCCVGPWKREYCSLQACCTYMCVQCSHSHRQEAPRHNDAGDSSSERWNLLGEKLPVIWPKVASSTLLLALLPLRVEDFFALKNPTASAGFEPANLGTKGQHATPRPPKPSIPLFSIFTIFLFFFCFLLLSSTCSFFKLF
jgi:hypothetical protein